MTSKLKPSARKKRDLVPVSRHLLESVVGGFGEAVVKRPETAVLLEHSVVAHDAGEGGGKAVLKPVGSPGGPKETSRDGPLLDPSKAAGEKAIPAQPHDDRAGEPPDSPGRKGETATAPGPDTPEPSDAEEGEARADREAEPGQRDPGELAEDAEPKGDTPGAAAEDEPVRPIRADRTALEAEGEPPVRDASDPSGPGTIGTAQQGAAVEGGDADIQAPAHGGRPVDALGKAGLPGATAVQATLGAEAGGPAPVEPVAAAVSPGGGESVESHEPASPTAALESHSPADNALVLPVAAAAGEFARAASREGAERTTSARPHPVERTATAQPGPRPQEAAAHTMSDADTLADEVLAKAPLTKAKASRSGESEFEKNSKLSPIELARKMVDKVSAADKTFAEKEALMKAADEALRKAEQTIAGKVGAEAEALRVPLEAATKHRAETMKALIEAQAKLKETLQLPGQTTRFLIEDPWKAETKALQVLETVRKSGSAEDIASAAAYYSKVKMPTDHDEKIKFLKNLTEKADSEIDRIKQEIDDNKFKKDFATQDRLVKERALQSKVGKLAELVQKNYGAIFDRQYHWHDARPQRFGEFIKKHHDEFSAALKEWRAAGVLERMYESQGSELLRDMQGAAHDRSRVGAFVAQAEGGALPTDIDALSKKIDELTAEKSSKNKDFNEKKAIFEKSWQDKMALENKESDISKKIKSLIDDMRKSNPTLNARWIELEQRQATLVKESSQIELNIEKYQNDLKTTTATVSELNKKFVDFIDKLGGENVVFKGADREARLHNYVGYIINAKDALSEIAWRTKNQTIFVEKIAENNQKLEENRSWQVKVRIEMDAAKLGADVGFKQFRENVNAYNNNVLKLTAQLQTIETEAAKHARDKTGIVAERDKYIKDREDMQQLIEKDDEARKLNKKNGATKEIEARISNIEQALNVYNIKSAQLLSESNKIRSALREHHAELCDEVKAIGLDHGTVVAIFWDKVGHRIDLPELDWSILKKRIDKNNIADLNNFSFAFSPQDVKALEELRNDWFVTHKARVTAMSEGMQHLQATDAAISAVGIAAGALADAKLVKAKQDDMFGKKSADLGGPSAPTAGGEIKRKTGDEGWSQSKGTAFERAVQKAIKDGKPVPSREQFEADRPTKAREKFLDDFGENALGEALGLARETLNARALSLAKAQGQIATASLQALAGGSKSYAVGSATLHALGELEAEASVSAYRSHLGAGASMSALVKASAGLAVAFEGTDALRGIGAGARAYAVMEADLRGKATANTLGVAADVIAKAALRGELAGEVSLKVADGIGTALAAQGTGSADALAKASGKLGLEGVGLKLTAAAQAAVQADVQGKIDLWGSEIRADVQAYAKARAEASAKADLSWLGAASIGLNAKAGTAVGIQQTGSMQFAGITVGGTIGVSAGDLGGSIGFDVGFKNNVLKIGIDFGAALGVGIDAKIMISIDFLQMLKKAEDFLGGFVETFSNRSEASKATANFRQLNGHNPFSA